METSCNARRRLFSVIKKLEKQYGNDTDSSEEESEGESEGKSPTLFERVSERHLKVFEEERVKISEENKKRLSEIYDLLAHIDKLDRDFEQMPGKYVFE